ncbi:hypothetical protein AB0J80_28310 [Actinoplanes sp. NPDC049548]|uniref:hypothetical protein n=1 Tax=Actinoplanes sp. NPDC049548 TaxID=3155152 RepID=UPI00343EEF14
MNTRTPLVLAAAAAVLAVGACSSNDATKAAPATSATPAPTATTSASGAPASTSPTVEAPPSSAAPVTSKRSSTAEPVANKGCPASEKTLLRAFRTSKVAEALMPTETLTSITCYKGYALGLTHPEKADDARVVFHYEDGAWKAIGGGTAEYCDGVVPAAIRPHLKHC